MLYNKKILNNVYEFIPNDKGYLMYLKQEKLYNSIEKDVTDWKFLSRKADLSIDFIRNFKNKLSNYSENIVISNDTHVYFKFGRFVVAYGN